MSTEAIHRLLQKLLAAKAVEEGEYVVHTSMTGDDVKRALRDVNKLWCTARLVMYSPTVEAGVDFNLEYFDRMFVFTCQGSTTPLGLMQMTGRVRTLKGDVIFCNAGRKVTATEQLEQLLWAQHELTDNLKRQTVKVDGGAQCITPIDDTLLRLHAFNEARRLNSQGRFFCEFRELAEDLGHKVMLGEHIKTPGEGSLHEARHPAATASARAKWLLEATDLTFDEARAVHLRIKLNDASGEDKIAFYKHCYKETWGIDRVDAAWIKAHGTDASAPHVRLLMQVLYPALRVREVSATVQSDARVLKAGIVHELITHLGFSHCFDAKEVKPPTGDFLEAIKTSCLVVDRQGQLAPDAQLKRMIHLFKPQAELVAVNSMEREDATRMTNHVLEAAGLKMVSAQYGSNKKGQLRAKKYWLCPKAREKMAVLLRLHMYGKLREVDVEGDCVWPEAGACIAGADLSSVAHLLGEGASEFVEDV